MACGMGYDNTLVVQANGDFVATIGLNSVRFPPFVTSVTAGTVPETVDQGSPVVVQFTVSQNGAPYANKPVQVITYTNLGAVTIQATTNELGVVNVTVPTTATTEYLVYVVKSNDIYLTSGQIEVIPVA